jgi:hypothetical protein
MSGSQVSTPLALEVEQALAGNVADLVEFVVG